MQITPININNRNLYFKKNIANFEKKEATGVSSQNVFSYLNAIGKYNISFCASKEPFYAVDENGNYKKYEGRKEAVDDTKIHGSSITQCLSEKRKKAGGYFFFWASQIETTDKNGNTIVDTEKLQKKLAKLTDPSTINRGQKAVYAIN